MFALFKFVQSSAAALAFLYSKALSLKYQLLLMVLLCVAGSIAFQKVERKARSAAPTGAPTEMISPEVVERSQEEMDETRPILEEESTRNPSEEEV